MIDAINPRRGSIDAIGAMLLLLLIKLLSSTIADADAPTAAADQSTAAVAAIANSELYCQFGTMMTIRSIDNQSAAAAFAAAVSLLLFHCYCC